MIELRPFLNSDSPGISAVWNNQPPLRGRVHTLTTTLLEQLVLSKPYFDPNGLIVAHESGQIFGFVHVGFVPGDQAQELNRDSGVICQLLVVPRADAGEVAGELLRAGEIFLRSSGAKELLGGGVGVDAPFYLGLYGGCRLPGILAGDSLMINTLQAAGYVEHRQLAIWQRRLDGFRPPIDREWVALRRQFRLEPLDDDRVSSWREACAFSWIERTQFQIVTLPRGARQATLTFWDIEPLAADWGERAMGLAAVTFEDPATAPNLLGCFLADAMRHFQTQGISLVEVHTEATNDVLATACQKLAFRQVDHGIQLRKTG
jgi:hypothetical protein